MRVEIVLSADYVDRGARIIQAMIDAAPVEVVVTSRYQAIGDVLMMYGCGHRERAQWWQQHRAAGGRCIAWDLGYWRRDEGFMRCSIDHLHPQRMLRPEPATRWEAAGIALRHDSNLARGPVIVAGMGLKSQQQFGLAANEWERQAVKLARKAWPDHEVVFRPKRGLGRLPGVRTASGSIEAVLCGAALVVCRHSNVAIDACIAGIPVVCEDGAGAALYGNDIARPGIARLDARMAFLQSLAWWQWRADEAKEAWQYLLQRLES